MYVFPITMNTGCWMWCTTQSFPLLINVFFFPFFRDDFMLLRHFLWISEFHQQTPQLVVFFRKMFSFKKTFWNIFLLSKTFWCSICAFLPMGLFKTLLNKSLAGKKTVYILVFFYVICKKKKKKNKMIFSSKKYLLDITIKKKNSQTQSYLCCILVQSSSVWWAHNHKLNFRYKNCLLPIISFYNNNGTFSISLSVNVFYIDSDWFLMWGT